MLTPVYMFVLMCMWFSLARGRANKVSPACAWYPVSYCVTAGSKRSKLKRNNNDNAYERSHYSTTSGPFHYSHLYTLLIIIRKLCVQCVHACMMEVLEDRRRSFNPSTSRSVSCSCLANIEPIVWSFAPLGTQVRTRALSRTHILY